MVRPDHTYSSHLHGPSGVQALLKVKKATLTTCSTPTHVPPAFYTTTPGRLRSVDELYLICGSARRCRGTRCIQVSVRDLCVPGCPASLDDGAAAPPLPGRCSVAGCRSAPVGRRRHPLRRAAALSGFPLRFRARSPPVGLAPFPPADCRTNPRTRRCQLLRRWSPRPRGGRLSPCPPPSSPCPLCRLRVWRRRPTPASYSCVVRPVLYQPPPEPRLGHVPHQPQCFSPKGHRGDCRRHRLVQGYQAHCVVIRQ